MKILGANSKVCYNEQTEDFHIINLNAKEGIKKIEGKYGIEAWCDIENTPRAILIPEATTLFGIKSQFLKNFM